MNSSRKFSPFLEAKLNELYALKAPADVLNFIESLFELSSNADYSRFEGFRDVSDLLVYSNNYLISNRELYKPGLKGTLTGLEIPGHLIMDHVFTFLGYANFCNDFNIVNSPMALAAHPSALRNLCTQIISSPFLAKLFNLKGIVGQIDLQLKDIRKKADDLRMIVRKDASILELEYCEIQNKMMIVRNILRSVDDATTNLPKVLEGLKGEIQFHRGATELTIPDVREKLPPGSVFADYENLNKNGVSFLPLLRLISPFIVEANRGRITADLDRHLIHIHLFDNPMFYAFVNTSKELQMIWEKNPARVLIHHYSNVGWQFQSTHVQSLELELEAYKQIKFEDDIRTILYKRKIEEIEEFTSHLNQGLKDLLDELAMNDALRYSLLVIIAESMYQYCKKEHFEFSSLLKDLLLLYFASKYKKQR